MHRLLTLTVVLTALASSATRSATADDVTANDLQLISGFSATVFHEGVGQRARQVAVRDNGDVFISRRDGTLIALRDTDKNGTADVLKERKLPITTGLKIHKGYLYFSDTVSVSRLALDENLMPAGEVETIVNGFPEQTVHATKSIAMNDADELFVNVGAPSNACQEERRSPGSPGIEPCPQLQRQAAIWQYSISPGQDQLDGQRFLTGTRNVTALDWNDAAGELYFVMHGRDQLGALWSEYFDDAASAEMPAEEFHRASKGADYGWPYTFIDPRSGKRLIAPEYGGDGSTEAQAGQYRKPLYAFPAHWSPLDLVFYSGSQFPESYQGGAFIAWQGSWNRAPQPQEGYRITFLPFADGAVAGEPIDFITGFKGAPEILRSSDAKYRPGGVAIGPAGSLYVADTMQGRIWKISYESP